MYFCTVIFKARLLCGQLGGSVISKKFDPYDNVPQPLMFFTALWSEATLVARSTSCRTSWQSETSLCPATRLHQLSTTLAWFGMIRRTRPPAFSFGVLRALTRQMSSSVNFESKLHSVPNNPLSPSLFPSISLFLSCSIGSSIESNTGKAQSAEGFNQCPL